MDWKMMTMTKMYCPMSYCNLPSGRTPEECTPDCAWAMKAQGRYFCAVPAKVATWVETINSEQIPTEIQTQPLKEDDE